MTRIVLILILIALGFGAKYYLDTADREGGTLISDTAYNLKTKLSDFMAYGSMEEGDDKTIPEDMTPSEIISNEPTEEPADTPDMTPAEIMADVENK